MTDDSWLAIDDAVLYAVAKLDLEPGDVVLVQYPCSLSDEEVGHIREAVKQVLGDVPFLLVDDRVEFSKISKRSEAA
jgi:hypothetical protein